MKDVNGEGNRVNWQSREKARRARRRVNGTSHLHLASRPSSKGQQGHKSNPKRGLYNQGIHDHNRAQTEKCRMVLQPAREVGAFEGSYHRYKIPQERLGPSSL